MNIDRFNGLHRSMPEARSALYKRFSSSEADGTNLVLQIKLVCCPRRTVKNGFADIVWSSVRLQFCISKTAVNKILGMKENI